VNDAHEAQLRLGLGYFTRQLRIEIAKGGNTETAAITAFEYTMKVMETIPYKSCANCPLPKHYSQALIDLAQKKVP
jgi:hypothetical protein